MCTVGTHLDPHQTSATNSIPISIFQNLEASVNSQG
uniref:Uncharacterized protein n=1 Tax=Anguilla anguilla TaxID=7936 RepID=A0A0E9QIJ9_ANGAN